MKLSIVTINYNNTVGLKRTMESVLAQSNKDFEYIIIDGCSTDGSVTIMNEYADKISSVGIKIDAKSEKDTGLYNAMNKGVRKSTGEYVLMLNSGDYLVDEDVINNIMPHLDGTDIVQGNTIRTKDNKQYVYRGYGKSDINFIDVQQGHFLHQASFCKRDLFDRFGYFDETYKIDADTVFYIRCLGYGDASFRYVDINVAYFDQGGRSDSSNIEWGRNRELEFERWSTELFSNRLWNTCIEYDKKGRLYDRIHHHKFLWLFNMFCLRFLN